MQQVKNVIHRLFQTHSNRWGTQRSMKVMLMTKNKSVS